MSFNIRYGTADDGPNAWPHRREAAISMIRDFAPDILSLQEALAFQIAELKQALPQYGHVGVGRDDGVEEGEFAPIFYLADSLNPIDSGTFWFSRTPNMPGSRHPECHHPRICTWGAFDGYSVYNLHLDNVSAESRTAAVRQLLDFIPVGKPSIVCGDFNEGEDGECIRAMRGTGFRDSFRTVHPEAKDATTFSDYGRSAEQEKIDYIWVSQEWSVLDAAILVGKVNGAWSSDHYPVTANLDIRTV